jgi:hypothetical protein
MGRPFYAVIIPLGEGGHPDQGLPGGGYYPDQGLPGGGNGNYPDQGLPGRPPHVGNRPPGSRPEYPSQGPVRPGRPVDPGFGWGGGEHPGNRPPGSWDRPEYPSTGPVRPERPIDPGYGIPELGDLGPAQPWVPPAGEELPPPPADIADQIVVAVWKPDEQAWKVAVAQGPHPAPHA